MDIVRVLQPLAESLNVELRVAVVLAGLLAALLVSTMVRLALLHRAGESKKQKLASLGSWWTLGVALIAATLLGQAGAAAFIGILAVLAMSEYLAMPIAASLNAYAKAVSFALVVLAYALIGAGYGGYWLIGLPLLAAFVAPVAVMTKGSMQGYARHAGGLTLMVLLLAFMLAHSAALASMAFASERDGVAVFLFLVLLTEWSDINQAWFGRRFGQHRLVPAISPNKTWEGLVAGVAMTAIAAALLGPHLLVMPWLTAAAFGVIIAVAGLLGDLSISGFKRDAGVKDSGRLLPGQGGALDRIDSLIFASPAFAWTWMLTA